jgi:methylthioxylose transferase
MAPRFRRAVLLAAAALLPAIAAQSDLLPLLRGPAPYPPEWQWAFAPKPILSRLGPVLFVSALLLGLLVATASARARRRPRAARRLALLLATVLGWGFQMALLHVERDGAVTGLAERTMSNIFTSYYTAALHPTAEDVPRMLAAYRELLAVYRGMALHAATHPPGPVLYYRALFGLFRSAPESARWVVRQAVRAGLDVRTLDTRRGTAVLDPVSNEAALATAVLGAALLALLGAATCVPVAALARAVSGDELGAARAGILWTVVPGAALMVPELDQALALLVASSTVALAVALGKTAAPPRLAWTVAAGLLGGLATLLSYGAPAFLAVGALAAIRIQPAGRPNRETVRVLAGALVVAAGLALLPALFGFRPLASAWRALYIHHQAFTRPRSYVLWLLFNPLDLALFLGPPLACLALFPRTPAGAPDAAGRFRQAVLFAVVLWLLSGTVRGEMGRIALPVLPLLTVAAVADAPAIPPGGRPLRVGPMLFLAALLMVFDVLLRRAWQLP